VNSVSNDEIARGILESVTYVVLATADADGTPWSSPVWFATDDYRELFWVSHPGARHSQNITVHSRIAMTVFDSTAAPGEGQAVYMSADAEQLTDREEIERGLTVFSGRAARQGIGEWGEDRVSGDARLRLYRARVHEHWILDPDSPYDVRVRVTP
jgi:nitroimidazol reductase NimA-like FMN-containing flavoprotein (pyridoxamine 5'-phosphate oxidase superfamily)